VPGVFLQQVFGQAQQQPVPGGFVAVHAGRTEYLRAHLTGGSGGQAQGHDLTTGRERPPGFQLAAFGVACRKVCNDAQVVMVSRVGVIGRQLFGTRSVTVGHHEVARRLRSQGERTEEEQGR